MAQHPHPTAAPRVPHPRCELETYRARVILLVLNLSVDPPPAFPAPLSRCRVTVNNAYRAYAVACATGAYLAVADSTHHLDDRWVATHAPTNPLDTG